MRERLSLDRGWLFHAGDIPSPVPNTHIAAYMNHKAGWSRGAARANHDDSDWRSVDLPHDWSIEGNFSPDNHLSAGFLPRGVGWYRRWFRLEESDRGRRISITFDGVATHCTVYVNGHLLHRHFCGYTPFTVDITDVATFGDALNVVAVRVDATYMEGWWYEGAGIYRHVWLNKTSALHFAEHGIFVAPGLDEAERWLVLLQANVCNRSAAAKQLEVVFQLHDSIGRCLREMREYSAIEPGESENVLGSFVVDGVDRWSLQSPRLYTLRAAILEDGKVRDQADTRFGFRTIRFDPNHGFFLNEQPIKLLGVCNHQDHAGVGVALPDSIHEFRIRKLKEAGCNAYRCAHHPPARELLDACDRLGMLVMDENRAFGSSDKHLAQLRAMVLRDRNHPSVVLWSICNEESIQTTEVSRRIAETMVAEVKKLDHTRPVTAAVSGGVLNDGCLGDALDVMCINYQLPLHDSYHEKFPNRPLIAGETHCVVSTRGVYKTDLTQCHLAADDTQKHPWGETARATWRHISARRYVAGLFSWTGFDYRGEPMPGVWPCVNSQMGFLDLCGFEKDSFHLHKAWWTAEPFVHLMPHWNWSPGEIVTVRAYTNCDEVELFLNDRSIGRKPVDPIDMVSWDVPFEPGELRAHAFRQGTIVKRQHVGTAGSPAALQLQCLIDESKIQADGRYAVPIKVGAIDASGHHVPTASNHVTFQVTGPGRILGVGNGDPTSHEPDRSNARHLFNGLAQLIVQTTGDAGEILVTAGADDVAPGTLRLVSKPAPASTDPIGEVQIAQKRHLITDWRASPITAERPDPNAQIAAADMNTWERVTIGPAGAPAMPGAGYRIYRATVTLPKSMHATGGRLIVSSSQAGIEIHLDGVPATPADAGAAVHPGQDKRTVSILVRSERAGEVIIAGPVELLPKV